MRKLLYIDSSYTLTQIRARGLDHVLAIRFLDGYFDRVWSAHPVDAHPAADPDIAPIGTPAFERLSDDHVFVRGRYGGYPVLARIAPLNALLALRLFVHALIKINDLATNMLKLKGRNDLSVEYGPPLIGDPQYFDIDNSKVRNQLGIEFNKDFWGTLRASIDDPSGFLSLEK